MALIFFEGFESYNASDHADVNALRNPNIFSNIASHYYGVGTGYGRHGAGVRWGTADYIEYTMANNYASFIVGIASKGETSTRIYSVNYPMLGFYDGTTLQLGFYCVGTEIHVYRGGTKIGETSGAYLSNGVWAYIEVKFTINNTSGSVVVRVNENVVLSLSSIDTQNSANAYFNKVRLGGIHNGYSYFDDIYKCDLTGSKNNDFLGDIRVDALRPNAAGTYTDFTPSAGANYTNVDETYGPDDDTTYNDGANVGNQDSYQMPDLPAPAGTTIYGVKSQITVRKTDAGATKCKVLTRAGTTDDLGTELTLSDSYLTPFEILEDNPDDAAAWADADVNGMEVGVKITVI